MSQAALRAIQPDVVLGPNEIESTPQCDLICVASFPRIIPPHILARAKRGGLNVHGALLPKHRGPDPLFWTYFDDDQEAGVTVHWMDEGVDSGDIVLQRSWPLKRGTRAVDLYMRQAEEGAALLAEALTSSTRVAQPPAPVDPSPNKHTWSIDYGTWSAERVWHFLNGMSQLRTDLLDVAYAPGFTLSSARHDRQPGTIMTRSGKIAIYCKDGIVEGRQLPLHTRLRRWLKRETSSRP